ncbi:putative conserved secreted protein [Synechococcus sp. SYN20]|nr:putative conserved secreted protein [Synechococcus sp. SYN20]
MKILLAPLLLAVSLPALAEVDPKIHKLCIEAKDYAGCVRAMKGEIVPSERTGVGNKCQSQFAYIGNGNCQRVGCKYGWWLTGRTSNNSIVAGKSNWKCKSVFRGGIYLSGSLILEEVAPVGSDENCPPIEPEIGWNSSCEKAPANWKEVEEAKKPKCDFKLEKYDCSYNNYLEANTGMKKWAELNPDMAEQERIRLHSVD